LIDKGFFGSGDQSTTIHRLDAEAAQSLYGNTTQDLVATFQKLSSLATTGIVGEQTANALNEELEKRGAFDQATAPRTFIISGTVRFESGLPRPNTTVRVFHVDRRAAIRIKVSL
jgi:peptidoglycan hydrolase-like protein with peptidoglycan-binding domain